MKNVTILSKACKHRILTFWDDKNNKSKSVYDLAENLFTVKKITTPFGMVRM